MDTIPRILFERVLMYATNDKEKFRSAVSWQRVSKQFSLRLEEVFWNSFPELFIKVSDVKRLHMRIGEEKFKSIDSNALKGLQKRGLKLSILFFKGITSHLLLPTGFADLVPFPTSIRLGLFQNLNDPELLRILQSKSDFIEEFHFHITNPSLSDAFINALLNFKSLKILTIFSCSVLGTKSLEVRKALFKQFSKLSLKCLIITSSSKPGYVSIFDEELFALLESKKVQCLHIRSSNHYVVRWLATNDLHNRAQITNLCINNDLFGYYSGEEENKTAPLFHGLADYKLLFPHLKFACIGICFAEFDDNRMDSMLLSYFLNNSFNIKLCLTVRLFHNSLEISFKRFDWVLSKLKMLEAKVIINQKSQKDAIITINAKDGNIFSEIIVCFNKHDEHIRNPEKQRCVDLEHYMGHSIHCFCAEN